MRDAVLSKVVALQHLSVAELRPQHTELWSQWSRIYNSQDAWEDVDGPQAAKRFYAANHALMDDGVNLLWPHRWSFYELRTQYEDDPISFNSELQNEPINPRDCIRWFAPIRHSNRPWLPR